MQKEKTRSRKVWEDPEVSFPVPIERSSAMVLM